VQALDPPGVAARTLTECLRIQLRVLGLEGSPADVMVRDHMKQLQSHQYPEISRQMGLSADEVAHHLEIIQGLAPRPGNRYSVKRSDYILPDVFVVKEGEEYRIVPQRRRPPQAPDQPDLPADARPEGARLGGDRGLREGQAPERPLAAEERRPAAAHHLQGGGVDRASPAAFLDHGISHLRPLVLRDVASDIGMHESTVSRVVANKYMHTRAGSTRCASSSTAASLDHGEAISSVTIKDRIKKMIEEEDASRPLSDSRIAEVLGPTGLPLARADGGQVPGGAPHPASNLRKTVH